MKSTFNPAIFTTEDFQKQLVKEIEQLKNIGPAKAIQIAEFLKKNKFRAQALLDDQDFLQSMGLSETVSFDEGVDREPMPLVDFVGQLRTTAMGAFGREALPEVSLAGRFMGQRGPFAKVQDSQGRIQVYLRKGTIGESDAEISRNDALIKLLHIGDFIGVKGYLFATQTGEVTLHVVSLQFLGKALRNLPIVKEDKEGNVYDCFY